MKTIGLISDKKSKKIFLLPGAVAYITNNGIKVNVPAGYGQIFNIADQQYISSGATIVASNKEVIANSDVICKVDVFTKAEIAKMNGKIAITMASYLANVDMLYFMLKNNVTGLAWNKLANEKGYVFFPEIEKLKGEMAVKVIADGIKKHLPKPKENVVYPHPVKLLILNSSFAGVAATKYALANGFDVTMLDHDKDYLQQLSNDSDIKNITAKYKTKFFVKDARFEDLEHEFKKANTFINTSINPEDRTKTRITKEMINSMPAGSILYDAGSEYGYAFAWIKKIVKPTLTYVKHGKNFYVTIQDNTDLIAKEFSEIVSQNSAKALVDVASQGQGNKDIARTVVCNKGKVVDLNVKTQLTLY